MIGILLKFTLRDQKCLKSYKNRLTATQKSSKTEQLQKRPLSSVHAYYFSVFTSHGVFLRILLSWFFFYLQTLLSLSACASVRCDASCLPVTRRLSILSLIHLFSASVQGPKTDSNKTTEAKKHLTCWLIFFRRQPAGVRYGIKL